MIAHYYSCHSAAHLRYELKWLKHLSYRRQPLNSTVRACPQDGRNHSWCHAPASISLRCTQASSCPAVPIVLPPQRPEMSPWISRLPLLHQEPVRSPSAPEQPTGQGCCPHQGRRCPPRSAQLLSHAMKHSQLSLTFSKVCFALKIYSQNNNKAENPEFQ